VSIQGRGDYSAVEVVDVPVGPNSAAEAQRWVQALLCACIAEENGYVPSGRVLHLFQEVLRGSPLEEHGVKLPVTEVLMKQLSAAGRMRSSWMLAAPSDLALPGMSEQDSSERSVA
jgi:hypothetical protein